MLGFYLASDASSAEAVAERFRVSGRHDMPLARYSALGSPQAAAAMIRRYVAAGASKFVVRPLCSAEEALEQLECFGREVLPVFHASGP